MRKRSQRKTLTQKERRWEQKFAALAKFRREHGHCLVPPRPQKNVSLSQWVAEQRAAWRSGEMHSDRFGRLNRLGFACDYRKGLWEQRLKELKTYQREHGHCQVPSRSDKHETLGNWVHFQRVQRRKGRLSADRIRRLNRIGFVWHPLKKRQIEHDAIWSQWLEKLIAFHCKNGHRCVPTDQRRYHRLRIWMDNQRINYHEGSLNKRRIM